MHLTEQTDQLRPTYFENVKQVVIVKLILFFRNMCVGGRGGAVAGRHCDNSSFIFKNTQEVEKNAF